MSGVFHWVEPFDGTEMRTTNGALEYIEALSLVDESAPFINPELDTIPSTGRLIEI